MMLIGLAGSAGTGKDTVADYLVQQHGFTKFSFSDALYREVSAAFNVPVEELQDRGNKELPHPQLTAAQCSDIGFSALMLSLGVDANQPKSPRWILQHWGTEYRRQQDPDYWLKQASLWVQAWLEVTKDDGEYHAGLVNTSVRFANEQEWVKNLQGVVWHLRRSDRGHYASELQHVAEQELPVGDDDRVIWNTGTVEQLHTAVSLMLQAPTSPDEVGVDKPLVVCKACGRVHLGYTEEQAADEVAAFSAWRETATEQEKEFYGIREATVDDYRGCATCGRDEFLELDVSADSYAEASALDGTTPVIYGGKQ